MLPELVQRCQLARYLSGTRDASVLPAWLLADTDLREMMGIGVKQILATEIKMCTYVCVYIYKLHCSLSLHQQALKLNLFKEMCSCL